MIRLYLVSAEYSSVCVFFCDNNITSLVSYGEDEIVGIDKYAAGSLAYDSDGNVAIYDGSGWKEVTA